MSLSCVLTGGMCPFRHISGEKTVVCKHWLRGLCKKGDQCEFLHEYDMTKMPECYFYSKFGRFIKSRRCSASWLVFSALCHLHQWLLVDVFTCSSHRRVQQQRMSLFAYRS